MDWWNSNNQRLIQTNLREPDAKLNLDDLIEQLKEFKANVWLMNVGGISSFYRTDLEYQYQNPHLDEDLLANAVEYCHDNDIRIVARFDFSKAHEIIFDERPEWFYQNTNGEEINYHGVVHTCVNGGYQQEYSLQIIDDVLSSYDVDGIFFNMFGYQHWDYDGTYHGVCHCENCQRRFRAMFGRDLPIEEDTNNPAYQDYQQFQQQTTHELLENVRELIDERFPEVAVSTYSTHGVDIVKDESNTSLDRDPHAPNGKLWPYSASENVSSIEDSFDDKYVSNVCINAVALQYRFHSVSKHETAIRLYQNLANGSGLDFCINGVFNEYPDQTNFGIVKEVYQFHAENERYYGNFESMADVGLVKPDGETAREYFGVFKALKESHIQFDVFQEKRLKALEDTLSEYELLILPDVRDPSITNLQVLSRLTDSGVSLVGTNKTLTTEGDPRDYLESIFGSEYMSTKSNTRGSYIETENKDIFGRLLNQDWVFIDGDFTTLSPSENAQTFLPYITPGLFGPPERVGYDGNERSEHSGMISVERNGTRIAHVPWGIGELYGEHGFEAHKKLLLDVIDDVLEKPHQLSTTAPPLVEIFFDRISEGYILQFVNLTGFNGVSYFEPTPVHSITTSLAVEEPENVRIIAGSDGVEWCIDGDRVTIEIDRVGDYTAIILENWPN